MIKVVHCITGLTGMDTPNGHITHDGLQKMNLIALSTLCNGNRFPSIGPHCSNRERLNQLGAVWGLLLAVGPETGDALMPHSDQLR